jgi:hypothetical protein
LLECLACLIITRLVLFATTAPLTALLPWHPVIYRLPI